MAWRRSSNSSKSKGKAMKIRNANKKGISSLIATVLMILITISSVGIIIQAVMPIIKNNLEIANQCDSIKLSINTEEGYSVYDPATNTLSISVSRGAEETGLAGIQIKLISSNGTSKVIEIKEGGNYSFIDSTQMPEINSEKVYLINVEELNISEIEKVSVAPIIKVGKTEKICNAISSGIEIPESSEPLTLNYTIPPQQPPAITWWNASWIYRQEINLSVLSGATPQDYQVGISISPSNIGSQFSWSNNCNDLRFVNKANTLEFPYWIEYCNTSSTNATVWIKISSSINTSSYPIYMYYGNNAANTTSNGFVTFEFFDDFQRYITTGEALFNATWNHTGTSQLYITPEGSGPNRMLVANVWGQSTNWASSKQAFAYNFTFEARTGAYHDGGIYGDAQPRGLRREMDPNYALQFISADRLNVRASTINAGSATNTNYAIEYYNLLPYKIEATSTNVKYYVNRNLFATHTTNIPSGPFNIFLRSSFTAWNAGVFALMDDPRIRKYYEYEPIAVFGSQETLG